MSQKLQELNQKLDDLEHDLVWEIQHGPGSHAQVSSRLVKLGATRELLRAAIVDEMEKQANVTEQV